MLGILFLICFFVGGWLIAVSLFRDKDLYAKIFIAGVAGITGAMSFNMPFSFIMGFNVGSNLLGMALFLAVAVYVWMRFGKTTLGIKFDEVDKKELLVVSITVLPIFLLISVLFSNHVLLNAKGDGALYGGQSTYGDLSMHLGMITSMAEQGEFPPEYSILPGVKLSYPFLVNSLSSALVQFGLPLREAVIYPSFVFALMLVLGMFTLAKEVTGKISVAVLSTVLFFFNGGFGFVYFFDKLKQNPQSISKIFTEYYKTPTNLNDNIVRWSNTICDMIIPQRTTMAGWTVVLLALYLLYTAIKSNKKELFIATGILAGLMPMIHTHSFFAFGIICAVWIFVYSVKAENKYTYLVNWLIFGGITLGLALPQLFIWTFQQASGSGFMKFHFNWANTGDNYFWFWIKNVGLVFLLIIPAFMSASSYMKRFYSGSILVFLVAEIIQFQPNEYDNNKLFYVWFILTVILVSEYMLKVYEALKVVGGRRFIASIVIFACVISGALTIGREYVSGGQMFLYSKEKVEAAEYVKVNTPKDAMFLTGQQHLNFVSALAGRNIVCGASLYIFFHGLNYQYRVDDVKKAYTNPNELENVSNKYKVDYLVLSDYELNDFKVNPQMYSKYQLVYNKSNIYIFAISERAKMKK